MDNLLNKNESTARNLFSVFLLALAWVLRTLFTLPEELTGITVEYKEIPACRVSVILFLLLQISIGLIAAWILFSVWKEKDHLSFCFALLSYASPLLFRTADNIVAAAAFLCCEICFLIMLHKSLPPVTGILLSAVVCLVSSVFLLLHAIKFAVLLGILLFVNAKKKERFKGILSMAICLLAGCAGNLAAGLFFPSFPAWSDRYLLTDVAVRNNLIGFGTVPAIIMIVSCILSLIITKVYCSEASRLLSGRKIEKTAYGIGSTQVIASVIILTTILSVAIREFFTPLAILSVYHFALSFSHADFSETVCVRMEKKYRIEQRHLYLYVILSDLILSLCGMHAMLYSAASVTFV